MMHERLALKMSDIADRELANSFAEWANAMRQALAWGLEAERLEQNLIRGMSDHDVEEIVDDMLRTELGARLIGHRLRRFEI